MSRARKKVVGKKKAVKQVGPESIPLPEPPAPVEPPADPHAPGRRRLTNEDRTRRMTTLMVMLAQGMTRQQACAWLSRTYHVGPHTQQKLLAQASAELNGHSLTRQAHLYRLHTHLRAMLAERKRPWSALMQLEQVVGRVAGTMTPIEVNHSGDVGVLVAGAIAQLTPDEAEAMVREELAVRERARLADRLVVDVPPQLSLVKSVG